MANEIKIEDGTGKVKRNLHIWAIGIFAIVAFAFLYYSEATKSPVKEEKEEKIDKLTTENKPKAEQLTKKFADQKELADKKRDAANASKPADLSVPVPSVLGEGVNVGQDGVATKQDAALTDEEIERKKREAAISGSSILAIDETKDLAAQAQRVLQNPAEFNLERELATITKGDQSAGEVMKAALAANQEPGNSVPATAVPSTSVMLDREWAKQNEQLNKPDSIKEDAPNSPYKIFQGSIIPSVLVSKVTSDLPGEVIATTTQDIYDGVSGRHLIIPKGSRVYGVYNNDINVGQGKIMVAFQRIVMPSGRSITLPGLPGADRFGQSGISGDVNNHFFKMYAGSALIAALGAIVDVNRRNNNLVSAGGVPSVTGQVTSSSGQVLVDLSRSILQRNNNIRPTISLEQGEKFNIVVKRDFDIPPTR